MLAQLASLTILFAVLLFLLSLPLGERPAAGALRRAAAFSLILAFVPSVLFCVVRPLIPHGGSVRRLLELIFAGVGLVAILGVLSLAAYGFIDLRKRAGTGTAPVAEGVRYAKRRPPDIHEQQDESDEREL